LEDGNDNGDGDGDFLPPVVVQDFQDENDGIAAIVQVVQQEGNGAADQQQGNVAVFGDVMQDMGNFDLEAVDVAAMWNIPINIPMNIPQFILNWPSPPFERGVRQKFDVKKADIVESSVELIPFYKGKIVSRVTSMGYHHSWSGQKKKLETLGVLEVEKKYGAAVLNNGLDFFIGVYDFIPANPESELKNTIQLIVIEKDLINLDPLTGNLKEGKEESVPKLCDFIDSFDLSIVQNYFDGVKWTICHPSDIIAKTIKYNFDALALFAHDWKRWDQMTPSEEGICGVKENMNMMLEFRLEKLRGRLQKYQQRGFCLVGPQPPFQIFSQYDPISW